MYDTHIHTNNSQDSKQTIDEICKAAIEKGVKVITLTDHTDTYHYSEERNTATILGTARDGKYAREVYGDKLKILIGTEIGESHYDLELTNKICSLIESDIILGSIHTFSIDGEMCHFSNDVLDENFPMDKLVKRFKKYYEELLITAQTADIDVLCHITYPLRYINGKYNRGIDINICADTVNDILKTIIKRGIALEVNTSGIGTSYNYPSPTYDIISEYYGIGGRLITLGSDAHAPEKIANGFAEVKEELRKIGFAEYFYYEKRKPIAVKL